MRHFSKKPSTLTETSDGRSYQVRQAEKPPSRNVFRTQTLLTVIAIMLVLLVVVESMDVV